MDIYCDDEPERSKPLEPRSPKPVAIALMVSVDEQRHIDAMRVRSYELAVARGHMRRG
jgi:hypothetical protein